MHVFVFSFTSNQPVRPQILINISTIRKAESKVVLSHIARPQIIPKPFTKLQKLSSQQTFACSKPAIEAPEQYVKST